MVKDKGTQGEQFVHQLADRSYISHWCFPNPKDEEGDKKEIIDLLIWLSDVLILISVKNYAFKGNHERYHRNTVEKAIRQIQGAERKLLSSGRDIIVMHPSRGRVAIQTSAIKQVVRLVVNLGEGEEYYELGRETTKEQFISILDRDTVETLFKELDTIRDLVGYFVEREKMFRVSEKIMVAGREKDLLAIYLGNARQMPDVSGMAMTAFDIEGAWGNFQTNPQKLARDKENRQSYFVDELVIRELSHMLNGWRIAEPLMLLSRFERRIFAKAFFDKYKEYSELAPSKTQDDVFHLKRYQKIGDVGFTFLFFQKRFDHHAQRLLPIAMYAHGINDNFSSGSLWAMATDEEMNRFHFAYQSNPNALGKEELEAIIHDVNILGWNKNLHSSLENFREIPDI